MAGRIPGPTGSTFRWKPNAIDGWKTLTVGEVLRRMRIECRWLRPMAVGWLDRGNFDPVLHCCLAGRSTAGWAAVVTVPTHPADADPAKGHRVQGGRYPWQAGCLPTPLPSTALTSARRAQLQAQALVSGLAATGRRTMFPKSAEPPTCVNAAERPAARLGFANQRPLAEAGEPARGGA